MREAQAAITLGPAVAVAVALITIIPWAALLIALGSEEAAVRCIEFRARGHRQETRRSLRIPNG